MLHTQASGFQSFELAKRSCLAQTRFGWANRTPVRTVVQCSQQLTAASTSLDMSVLYNYQARKLIRSRKHPTEDLLIWNYSDRVNNHGPWDEITNRTRALVTDSNGNIVAHSFRKFHDLEKNLHTATDTFEVFEKLDGSLGSLFWYNDNWMFCTRASFDNHIIDAAKELLNDKYDVSQLSKDLAYSFEVILPRNRVVIDYRGRSELVFLAAFTKDGTEMYAEGKQLAQSAGFPLVKSYPYDDYKDIKKLDWENSEGFVVRFTNGDRAKVKFPTYLCLHRALTGLNALRIWELFMVAVRDGKTFEQCMAHIPSEYWDWARLRWDVLQKQHAQSCAELDETYQAFKAETGASRQEFGRLAGPHRFGTALFLLFDGGDEANARVWLAKSLKPSNTAKAMRDKPPKLVQSSVDS